MSAQNLGDFREDTTHNFYFNTHTLEGVPIILGGTIVIAVYKDGSTSQQIIPGADIDINFDGKTGIHRVKLDLATEAFFVTGADYSVAIITGTVDGQSVNGTVISNFSIENSNDNVESWNGTDVTGDGDWATDVAPLIAAIADLITRTKGLDDIHDDLVTHEAALTSHDADMNSEHVAINTNINDNETKIDANQTDLNTIISTGGAGPWTTAVGFSTLTAAQVWDYLLTAILTVGSIGKLLKDNIDAVLSTLALDSTVAKEAAATTNKNSVITEVDANETKIDANLVAIQTIQNNTRFSSSPPTPVIIPETGDMVFKISCGLFDTAGNPEDPDSQDGGPQIAILGRAIDGQANKVAFFDDEAATTGATASVAYGTFLKMVKTSVGRYETYYKLPSTEAIDNWTFTFKYLEASVEFIRERGISIVEENPDSVTLANTDLNKKVIVEAIREDVSPATTVPEANSIQSELEIEINANETKLDTIISTGGAGPWTTAGIASNPFLLQSTTLNVVTSNTLFTIVAGSADNDAYNNCIVVIIDASTATQKFVGVISDYVGATKTVTLHEDTVPTFTLLSGDTIFVLADASLKSLVNNRYLAVIGNKASANVEEWKGSTVPAPTIVGVPEVDITHVSGVAEDISTETKQDIIDANVDSILVDTTAGGAGPWTTAVGFSTHAAVDVWNILAATAFTALSMGAKLTKFVFTSAGRVDSNVEAINDDTTAADKAAKASLASYSGVVGAGAHTALSVLATDLTGFATNVFLNKTFNVTSAGADGAGAVVETYDSGTGAFTFKPSFPLPSIPASGAKFTVS